MRVCYVDNGSVFRLPDEKTDTFYSNNGANRVQHADVLVGRSTKSNGSFDQVVELEDRAVTGGVRGDECVANGGERWSQDAQQDVVFLGVSYAYASELRLPAWNEPKVRDSRVTLASASAVYKVTLTWCDVVPRPRT